MSIKAFFVFLIILASGAMSLALAEDANVVITLPKEMDTAIISINGLPGHGIDLKFEDSYAGFEGIAKRIANIKCFDPNGQNINCSRQGDGKILKIEYSVDLKPFEDLNSAAHVSWRNDGKSLLMLNDILPTAMLDLFQLSVEINAPAGWEITTSENLSAGKYKVKQPRDAVFFASENGKVRKLLSANQGIELAIEGAWGFADKTAVEFTEELLKTYSAKYGKPPIGRVNVLILKYPGKMERNRWRAETRGNNIAIISSGAVFEVQDAQRLNEQLRHEIFHLWIPGAINLSGNYAWFYEGFGSYVALKTGAQLKRIRFEDYLNVLGQAYAMEQRRSMFMPIAKIESGSSLYVRGILAGFAADLNLLEATNGKSEIDDVIRYLIEKYSREGQIAEGNPAIINALLEFPALTSFTAKFIESGNRIDLTRELKLLGIEALNSDFRIIEKPSKSQKELLRKLGYN